jgi:Plasmid pRiA4b ORF-3-like protein
MIADTIARIEITLDNVKPVVLRRIEVPLDIRLDRLHLAIQAAMGWTNTHLYELRADGVGWSTPDPDADWTDFLDARKARLGDILEDIGTKTLAYLYDFGDGWEHTIKIERLADPEPGELYRGSSKSPAAALPKTAVAPGAMLNSSPPSRIRDMSDMPSSRNGSATTSIPIPTRPSGSQQKSETLPEAGAESQSANAPDAADPRSSPEDFDVVVATIRPNWGRGRRPSGPSVPMLDASARSRMHGDGTTWHIQRHNSDRFGRAGTLN